ncbi:hypothetical protein IFM89_026275 [Coptis chinensis]|uniref:Uncharacterized protein n=1 Tax=Coptis chinensis TaxID=261450 RepID=A0A835IXN7_9MAGN|nr:hypothetical protein IFM89_026275 [Coptis chinensis]
MAFSKTAVIFTVYFAILVLSVVADSMPGMMPPMPGMDSPAPAPNSSVTSLPSMVVGLVGFVASLLVLKDRI